MVDHSSLDISSWLGVGRIEGGGWTVGCACGAACWADTGASGSAAAASSRTVFTAVKRNAGALGPGIANFEVMLIMT